MLDPMSRRRDKDRADFRRRLEVFGFDGRAPRGHLGQAADAGARLRGALHGLGPVAQSLGLELSTRLDLLPPADAFELSRLEAVPLLDGGFESHVETLLGEGELDDVDPLPFHQTPTQEWRRARLNDGTEVDLGLGWRGEPVELGVEVGCWRSCLDRLRAPGWEPLETADLERFEDRLTHTLSLDHQAWALDRAAKEATGGASSWARPIRRLCRPSLLVTHALDSFFVGGSTTTDDAESDEIGRQTRQIVLAWLEASLFDGWMPQPPLAAHLARGPEGGVSVRGGLWHLADSRLRRSIRTYLAALVDGDADQALDALLDLALPGRGPATGPSAKSLRHVFRQAEPFRDGSATGAASGGRVADLMFLHWRLMRRHGYRPRDGWASFQQGFADLEWLARRHAGHRDVVEEALEDLRWIDLAHQGRELLTPSAWPRRLAETLPALDEIDEHLRRLAAPEEEQRREEPPRKRLAALLVVAVLGVCSKYFPSMTPLEPWLAGAFIAIAIALLLPSWLGQSLDHEPPFGPFSG